MKKIALTQGQFALVDDEDFERINKHKWMLHSAGYSNRSCWKGDIKTTEFMHRVIMEAKFGDIIDHKNHNKLDNRKRNLRIVSPSQNCFNQSVHKRNKSGYKGVCKWWVRKKNGDELSTPWRAFYKKDGKQIHIGSFKTAREAAMAYNDVILKERGEYAFVNEL